MLSVLFIAGAKLSASEELNCIVHSSNKYKACIQNREGKLIRLSDNTVLMSFGFSPSSNYGGQSPGLNCQAVRFTTTKFGEELAVFDCDGLDLSSNFCGRGHGAGYIESQNNRKLILPKEYDPSTSYRTHFIERIEVLGDNQNIVYQYSVNKNVSFKLEFNQPVVKALRIEPHLNNLGQVLASFVQITLADGTVKYYEGTVEHYIIANGILSTNFNELCQQY